MGSPRAFPREKLVIGVLASPPAQSGPLLALLEGRFGPSDWASPPLPFTYTHYYDAEMGGPITRYFLSFRELVDPGSLARIKLATNRLEEELSHEGRRRVNLDPGLVSLSRFILASTKAGAHRIALADGIYAEITLIFQRGRVRAVEWTYPDYRSPEYLEILNHIRGLLKSQLRSLSA
jgi:hypothetical protein